MLGFWPTESRTNTRVWLYAAKVAIICSAAIENTTDEWVKSSWTKKAKPEARRDDASRSLAEGEGTCKA